MVSLQNWLQRFHLESVDQQWGRVSAQPAKGKTAHFLQALYSGGEIVHEMRCMLSEVERRNTDHSLQTQDSISG